GNTFNPYTWVVKGKFSFKDKFTIPPGGKGFGIPEGSLEVNTAEKEYTGELTVQLPTGTQIAGKLGLKDGKVNAVRLRLKELNKGPLGEVPVWLQKVGMEADNLTDPEKPLTFKGDIGFTLGPKLETPIVFSLPSWTGIKDPLKISSLASLDGTGEINID